MDVYGTIYHGDCRKVLRKNLTEDSVQLVFADPPYNLSGRNLSLQNNTTGGPFHKVNEKWDTWDYDSYVSFTGEWLAAIHRVLSTNGSLYVSCTQHNIGEILVTARGLGFRLNNIITWHKINAMPNITRRTFTHATEFVCWFVKGKNWVFNYEAVKSLNPGRTKDGRPKQMRDFLDFIELPVVQGKERMRGDDGRALHPTQKPERLIELLVTASSKEGDTVLDPFFGTGTTGIVAARLGRKWIGIEKDGRFVSLAEKRLAGEHPSVQSEQTDG